MAPAAFPVMPLSSLTTSAPGASPPVWDELTFPEAIQMEEVHLFCAQDSHAGTDRGGRNLWALQKNQKPVHPRTDNYDALLVGTSTDKLAANWQKWVGYASHAKGTPPQMIDVIHRLPYDRLFHFAGNGAGDQPGGSTMTNYFGGTEIQTPNDSNVFAHAQRLLYLNPDPNFYTVTRGFYFLDRIFPYQAGQPLPFRNLLLAVWEGCVTAKSNPNPADTEDNFGNLVDGTVALGAKCSVGFNGLISIGPGTNDVWATNFWQALTVGEGGNHSPDAVSAAILYANTQVKLRNQNNFDGYDSCRWAGDATIKIAPVH